MNFFFTILNMIIITTIEKASIPPREKVEKIDVVRITITAYKKSFIFLFFSFLISAIVKGKLAIRETAHTFASITILPLLTKLPVKTKYFKKPAALKLYNP
ncbi:unnamed protein product [marine sediment metagenome]|uniref:Uncharacterized protein n=1 Tax=marine sediment metagenome TaxID=412755 RepID=X1RU19_9ZZZZ